MTKQRPHYRRSKKGKRFKAGRGKKKKPVMKKRSMINIEEYPGYLGFMRHNEPDDIYLTPEVVNRDIEDVAATIGHEELHHVLLDEAGPEATHGLDNLTELGGDPLNLMNPTEARIANLENEREFYNNRPDYRNFIGELTRIDKELNAQKSKLELKQIYLDDEED